MFTVTHLQTNDRLIAPSYSWYGSFVAIAFRKTAYTESFRYGIRPSSHIADKYGNSDCTHLNVEGSIFVAAQHADMIPYTRTETFYVGDAPAALNAAGSRRTFTSKGFKLSLGGKEFHAICYNTPGQRVEWNRGDRYYTESYRNSIGQLVYRWYYYEEIHHAECLNPQVFHVGSRTRKVYPNRDGVDTVSYNNSWVYFTADGTKATYEKYSTAPKPYSFSNLRYSSYPNMWDSLTLRRDALLITDAGPGVRFNKKLAAETLRSFYGYPGVRSNSEQFGELTDKAVLNAKYLDINTSMYIADLFKLRQLFTDIASGLTQKNLRPDQVAKFLLAADWGLGLTVKDTDEIIGAATRLRNKAREDLDAATPLTCPRGYVKKRRRYSKLRARSGMRTGFVYTPFGEFNYTARSNCLLLYSPLDDPLERALLNMYAWDLVPHAGVLWDFTAYSWLINKVYDFSSLFEKLHMADYSAKLRIRSCMYSDRIVFTHLPVQAVGIIPPPGSMVMGNLSFTYYSRAVLRQPFLPSLWSNSPTNSPRWLVDMGALMLSDRR